MSERAKAKTYGKRPRNRDLVEAFGSLAISDSDRPPLVERCVNSSETLPGSLKTEKPVQAITRVPEKMSSQRVASEMTVPIIGPKTKPIAHVRSPRRGRAATQRNTVLKDSKYKDETEYLKPLTILSDVEPLVQHFDQWAETMEKLLEIVMIGDGTYANVFKLSPKSNAEEYSIAKLIPLRPKRGLGSRSVDLTTIDNAASEIRLLAKLSGIKGFTDFRRAMLLRGKLPLAFRSACKTFEKEAREKADSNQEYERSLRLSFPKQQIWLFIEMGDAGEEMEKILFEGFKDKPQVSRNHSREACLTVRQTRDIFYSTVEALAFGEQEAQFEHRDLHLSNICLKRVNSKADTIGHECDWQLVPKAAAFEVTLIDYTLSRAAELEGVMYNRMDDEELFCGENNPQYDCYRYMKQAVDHVSAGDWSCFAPGTNIIWLHYILQRLLEKTMTTSEATQEQIKERHLYEMLQKIANETQWKEIRYSKYSSAADLLLYMEDQHSTYLSGPRP